MSDNPFTFESDEDRDDRRARRRAKRMARAAARLTPPPARFVTNRQACLACVAVCAVPAILLGIIPAAFTVFGGRVWPMEVVSSGGMLTRFLLYGPGWVCAYGLLMGSIFAVSRDGLWDTGRRDGSDMPIFETMKYRCPGCGARWRWHQLPTFHSAYRCPQCGATGRAHRSDAFSATGVATHLALLLLSAVAGYVGLAYLLLAA